LNEKLRALKIAGIVFVEILRLPFRSLRTKNHLDVALVERRRIYYKGEGVGFP
jgi:hypothetical protein